MAVDQAELEALRDGLIPAIGRGTRRVEYDGKRVEYASTDEMRAALADRERRLAAASSRKHSVGLRVSKGV